MCVCVCVCGSAIIAGSASAMFTLPLTLCKEFQYIHTTDGKGMKGRGVVLREAFCQSLHV